MPFFERNSFVLRQLLQPGWVNKTNLSSMFVMINSSRHKQLNCAEPINRYDGCQLSGNVEPQESHRFCRTAKDFAACANFRSLSVATDCSRAKTPRTPSSENIFSFAAFAPLREIFRFLVAALPRWVLCG